MKKRIGILAALLLVVVMFTAGDMIDRIAAVVNQEIILVSEVDEKMFILESQGQLADRDSTEIVAIRREVLNRLVEERLVVQRAKSQGITADEQEVTMRVDQAMGQVRGQFPTLTAYQEALRNEGLSETMLRERYETDVRQEMLAQRIVAREIRSQVEITTDQAQKYFDEHKDELPQRPEEVHIAHILVVPQAGAQAGGPLDEIKAARLRIEGGESFAEVAEEVSDDPSRTRGGVLGWFQTGDLDLDFEAAVAALEVGELSEPVRTRFGFHLIEVMDRDGDRFEVRHILKMVELGDDAVASAQERAEEARELVVAGEPFEDVAARMSDDELTRDTGGDLGWTPVASLMPAVSSMVDSLGVNGLSPVITSERGFHVFKILDRRTGGAYEFDEVSDQLKTLLEQQELEKAYDEWMGAVRDSAYVEIKTW